MKPRLNVSDVRGLTSFAIETATKVTDAVEELHGAIATPFGLFRAASPRRTNGITGFVYRSIRVGYRLTAGSFDALLNWVAPMFETPSSTPEREKMLAVLNGVWGDQLAATANPLAIQMSLRYDGRSLTLRRDAVAAAIPQASGRLLILVHGLCMNDLQWARDGHDHGAALAADLGYTPVHLHYNSGLHVSTNGRQFADQLERLVREWPQPVEEIVLIAHSMGGLVARSACHYGGLAGHAWVQNLRKMIFLGTPHHGSHLERLGNWVGDLLNSTSYSAPFGRLGMNRSHGITDLRHGCIVDEDWDGIDRFARGPDKTRPVSLPDCVQCYAVGATLGAAAGDVKDRLMGDGLVPLDSALGLHQDCDRELPLPPSHTWVGYNMGHLDLLDRPEVYAKIREWLLE